MVTDPDRGRGSSSEPAAGRPDLAEHWNRVFATRAPRSVSWHQQAPETSLRLLRDLPGSVVDVGAGSSTLVDELLAEGRDDVTVLDVSAGALELSRQRLGPSAAGVRFVVTDLLAWQPERRYDAWHDRAVLHFLTDPAEQVAYADLAARAVRPGGGAVVGVFAEDGPTECSGLPTARHSADTLAALFAPWFSAIRAERQVHVTPDGRRQPFTWLVLRRDG